MKRILSIAMVAALLVIVHGKTVIAQDAKTPHKSKTERHIKWYRLMTMVKKLQSIQ